MIGMKWLKVVVLTPYVASINRFSTNATCATCLQVCSMNLTNQNKKQHFLNYNTYGLFDKL